MVAQATERAPRCGDLLEARRGVQCQVPSFDFLLTHVTNYRTLSMTSVHTIFRFGNLLIKLNQHVVEY